MVIVNNEFTKHPLLSIRVNQRDLEQLSCGTYISLSDEAERMKTPADQIMNPMQIDNAARVP